MARKIRIPTATEITLLRERVAENRECIERATNRLKVIKYDENPSIRTQFDQISATLRKKANTDIEEDLIAERERLSAEIKALDKEKRRLKQSLKGCLALNTILSLELDISKANVEMSGGNAGTAINECHSQH